MKKFIAILLSSVLCSASIHAVEFVGNYQSHISEGNRVVFTCSPAYVTVEFCTEDMVKVSLNFVWSPDEDSSFVIVQDSWPAVACAVEEGDSALHILSGTYDIVCQKYPFRLSFHHRSGGLLVQERPEGGLGWQNPNQFVYFSQSSQDHFYGLGMRAIDLDRKGQSFDTYNRHGAGDAVHATMGINIPLVCTTSGYGIYFDNTYTGRFDFGEENPDYWFYRTDGGKMAYYLIYGPDMKDILEKYTWLTGRQPLPPRWALGMLQSKFGYRNENEAKAMISTMREKHIPCDAIILDLYWFGTPGDMGRLDWNLRDWPDPQQMMADCRDFGIKTILIEEPYVTTGTGNFTEGSYNGYFGKTPTGGTYTFSMWAGNAGLVDFTNPASCEWWWSKHVPLLDQGVAGWWTDLGEPETHPEDMVHHFGSAAQAHNILNLLWSKTIFDGYRSYRPDERVFIVTRSGYAGMQRYGTAPWSGDVSCSFQGLANQIPIMLGMSMSGIGYQHSDISGFSGNPSGELYARWMEFGTFCPITRPHGVGHATEPWGYGSQVEAICKKYITLRYRLLPYLYTMAFQNTTTGLPLARPLVLEYPEDPALANFSSEYLWGDDFLVAPVTQEGATTKHVYLPRGEWIDYWTKEMLSAGFHIIQAPLDVLPLFVKSGAIIPMAPVMDYSDQMPLDTVTLDIYPSGFSSAILYEDDGQSYHYQSGDWDTTRFTCQVLYQKTVVGIGPAVGNFSQRLANRIYVSQINGADGTPDSVRVNDRRMASSLSSAQFELDAEGWWFDPAQHVVKVKINTTPDAFYRLEICGTDFPFECQGLNGDPNNDGVINVLDVLIVVLHIVGEAPLSGEALCRADCAADGIINVQDVLSIVNLILRITPECPRTWPCRPVVSQDNAVAIDAHH